MIELRHISKTFQHKNGNFTALKDVSLFIPKGKVFGIIGASGAGKSTLIRTINLLERPTAGTVSIDGVEITSLSASDLAKQRRHIGMIFQHFNLLSSRTVFENVALPLELEGWSKAAIKERVLALLELVSLADKADHYPVNLSGGQKQRVAIARTLANSPKVLLCDEATSALDPATTNAILTLLKDINQRLNITILLITHEMKVIKKICDEVAVISAGEIVERGLTSAVFSNPTHPLTREFILEYV